MTKEKIRVCPQCEIKLEDITEAIENDIEIERVLCSVHARIMIAHAQIIMPSRHVLKKHFKI